MKAKATFKLSFATPLCEYSQKVADAYWEHTLTDGAPVFTHQTRHLEEKAGITSRAELLKIIKAQAEINFQCTQCKKDMVITVEVTSKTSLLTQLGYCEWKTCNQCDEKSREEHRQDELERKRNRESDTQRKMHKRSSKVYAMTAQYGARLIDTCPDCSTGFLVIKINNKTMELFIACTSYGQCSHTQTIDKSNLADRRNRFLQELSTAWNKDEVSAEAPVYQEVSI